MLLEVAVSLSRYAWFIGSRALEVPNISRDFCRGRFSDHQENWSV
jgi:hypothetical protein